MSRSASQRAAVLVGMVARHIGSRASPSACAKACCAAAAVGAALRCVCAPAHPRHAPAAQERHPDAGAVASGAIASDYQRLRMEDVCARLGLVSLAYLWHQPQEALLRCGGGGAAFCWC